MEQKLKIFKKNFLPAICFCFILISCDTNRVFEENKQITGNIWNKDSIISFKVEITDTVSSHDILINIRNEGTYPYSNIFFFTKMVYPNEKFIKDTVEYILADANGKWLGKGFGNIWSNQFLYKQNVVFPMKGKYIFEIAQGLRAKDNQLEGIKDIGLRIEKK